MLLTSQGATAPWHGMRPPEGPGRSSVLPPVKLDARLSPAPSAASLCRAA